MKDETLLDRAHALFGAAKMNYSHIEIDDIYLNLTGYLLQQTLEIYLKHHLEVNGIRYPKTRDIVVLINMLPDDIELDERLALFAGTITTWESKTRYIKNYFLEKKSLETGLKLIAPLFGETWDSESKKNRQHESILNGSHDALTSWLPHYDYFNEISSRSDLSTSSVAPESLEKNCR